MLTRNATFDAMSPLDDHRGVRPNAMASLIAISTSVPAPGRPRRFPFASYPCETRVDPLPYDGALELGEHPSHLEHGIAGRCGGVHIPLAGSDCLRNVRLGGAPGTSGDANYRLWALGQGEAGLGRNHGTPTNLC